jgi:hypothetical protein
VKLVANPMYAGGGGDAAPPVIVYAVPMEEEGEEMSNAVYADAAHVAAGSVVYDAAGGEAQYVARDGMAGGAGNVNYEVVDAGGDAAAAAPRPGVLGNGAVVVGARAQLPGSATSNAVYDGVSQPTNNNTGNTAVYDMGPESEQQTQQQQQQQQRGAGVVVHAPPAYAVPVKILKSRPDENNLYDMQVPGKKSAGAAAATAARVAREAAAATASSSGIRPDENNTYDMQVPGKKSNPAAGGGAAKKQKCTRPSPTGEICKKNALPSGGMFCVLHACPECGAGKSSSAPGCPEHTTRPRKQSVYTGFDEQEEDAEAYC